MQRMVIAAAEMNAPIAIAMNEYFKSRPEKPAIKLPDHTPVSGSGTATKVANIRYFLKFEFDNKMYWLFREYFSISLLLTKPVALLLIFLAKIIAK